MGFNTRISTLPACKEIYYSLAKRRQSSETKQAKKKKKVAAEHFTKQQDRVHTRLLKVLK